MSPLDQLYYRRDRIDAQLERLKKRLKHYNTKKKLVLKEIELAESKT